MKRYNRYRRNENWIVNMDNMDEKWVEMSKNTRNTDKK